MNLLIFTTLFGNVISFTDNAVNFLPQSPMESMAKFMKNHTRLIILVNGKQSTEAALKI